MEMRTLKLFRTTTHEVRSFERHHLLVNYRLVFTKGYPDVPYFFSLLSSSAAFVVNERKCKNFHVSNGGKRSGKRIDDTTDRQI